jgi:hypothetical protein
MKIDKYGNLVEETAEDLAQAKIDNEKREADIQAEQTAKAEKDALKASAKAKLIAGEALTEDEANTIVL